MPNSMPLVTIFGGSGFVGRYIAQRMARAGWRVRVAVRRPNEAMFVQPYGDVGQVVPILANIRNADSTRRAIAGADAVINCVGILHEDSRQKFDVVQSEAAGRIARLATEAGVSKLVHLSALGADVNSKSAYVKSKADGEAAILRNFPSAVILRPSVVFGSEDKFFNRYAAISRLTPVIPLFGADTKFQPVYVDDIAAAAEQALTSDVTAGIYELGGPDVATTRELIANVMNVVHRKRLLVAVPMWFARMKAWGFDMVAKGTRGLIPAIISRDQLKMLQTDNVVSEGAKGFADLGIAPTPMSAVLDGYLYCYRPSGQYDVITDSGKNLKI